MNTPLEVYDDANVLNATYECPVALDADIPLSEPKAITGKLLACC